MTATESFWSRWFSPPTVVAVEVRHLARLHDAPARVEVAIQGWGWLWVGAPGTRPLPFRGRFVREGRYPLLIPTDQPFVARCWNILGRRRREVRLFGSLAAPRIEVPHPSPPPGPPPQVVAVPWRFIPALRQRVDLAVSVPTLRIRLPDLTIPVRVRVPRFEEEKTR